MNKQGVLFTALMALLLLVGCSTGFKMDSGIYRMSLANPSITDSAVKNVTVTIDDKIIKLNLEGQTGGFSGMIKDNRLNLQSDSNSDLTIEGEITADNTVKGFITQKNGTDEITSEFSLVVTK